MGIFIQQVVNGVVNGGIYSLIAVGLTMIFGVLDIINFAHGELYMIGAYLVFVFAVLLKLPFALACVLSLLGGAALGVILERVAFRPLQGRPMANQLIASMGLSIVLANGSAMIFSPTPRHIPSPFRDIPLEVWGVNFSLLRVLILVISVAIIVGLTLFVNRTWIGLAMRTMAQDLTTSYLMGIDTRRVRQITFALGSALAATAGVLVGPLLVVEPHMGGVAVLKAFAIVIMGGMGNIPGAIVAALILGVAESLAAGYIGAGFKEVIAFTLMILILLVKPSGILSFGTAKKV